MGFAVFVLMGEVCPTGRTKNMIFFSYQQYTANFDETKEKSDSGELPKISNPLMSAI